MYYENITFILAVSLHCLEKGCTSNSVILLVIEEPEQEPSLNLVFKFSRRLSFKRWMALQRKGLKYVIVIANQDKCPELMIF